MKAAILVLLLVLGSSVNAKPGNRDLTNHEDRIFVNFIKFMSALMISEPKLPAEVESAVRVVVKEMLNGQPHAQGYMSYMMTSMLRVMMTPLKIQVDNMLTMILQHSETNSLMANAAETVQEYLLSGKSKANFSEVSKYVSNLFQPINTLPSKEDYNSPNALEVLLPSRPANRQ